MVVSDWLHHATAGLAGGRSRCLSRTAVTRPLCQRGRGIPAAASSVKTWMTSRVTVANPAGLVSRVASGREATWRRGLKAVGTALVAL